VTDAVTRSYLADGRVVRWHPPDDRPWAIDAELIAQSVPPALVRRTGVADPEAFWPAWTALETVCKLLDEPVLLRLRSLGLDGGRHDDIRLWTRRHRGIIVTIGVLTNGASVTRSGRASRRR
jgi:hypothetical protein